MIRLLIKGQCQRRSALPAVFVNTVLQATQPSTALVADIEGTVPLRPASCLQHIHLSACQHPWPRKPAKTFAKTCSHLWLADCLDCLIGLLCNHLQVVIQDSTYSSQQHTTYF
jgi:hypothetical protein